MEISMISTNTLEIRSASSRSSRPEALPMNMNAASVVAVAELLAKLVELLRSSSESRETVLSVGPLQLDLLTRTARRGERTIDLLPREFLLAEYMMRRQGQVLTRAMLFREVWNYKFIPKSNLADVHVGRLRRKIDQTDEWPMIYTIRGRGFVLRAPQLAAMQWRIHDRTAAGGRLYGLTAAAPERVQHVA
jgi:DNA-binding winged helix-turn-helix (wHTH) protein